MQSIAGDMLVIVANTNGQPLFERILQQVMAREAELTDARLAFNVACLYALSGQKQELLRWARRARDLGKPPEGPVSLTSDQE